MQPFWKIVWQSSKNWGQLLYEPEIPLPREMTICPCKYWYTNSYSNVIHNSQKQPKCPSIDECLHNLWYIHTMKDYSAIKRNKGLIYAIIWINLENTMLNVCVCVCVFIPQYSLTSDLIKPSTHRVLTGKNLSALGSS